MKSLRERFARIIEPGAWERFDEMGSDNSRTRRDRDWSLQRADQIITLIGDTPMKKTAHEITMKFGEGRPAMGAVHDITIPAGTRVSGTGDGQFFVEDLSWLDRNSIVWHDANYYGIRLNADQVTE